MRVLIDYRAALRSRSGVGEYTHQLVAALLRSHGPSTPQPIDLTLFSSSWKDRFPRDPQLDGAASVDRRVPVSLLNLLWHRLGWPAAESLARGAFDVTHSLHPLLLPARRAAQVVTIHDLDFLTHPERTRAEIRRDYPALARSHAHRADRVVVPSRFTAGEVTRLLGVPAERISVCSPGAPDWTPTGPAPADGYLLFIGTLEPRKNVGGLLDAYARLCAVGTPPPLVIAGRATAEAQPWLDRRDAAPLKGRVRLLGYVDPDRRRAVYEGARLLIQPSFEEGFGLPVLEAMTLGLPVVAANRGALPDVLGDAGPLIDPGDPEAMAHAIASVLNDAGFAAACAAKGLARAAAYRWAETAARTVEAYQLAIAQRARRH